MSAKVLAELKSQQLKMNCRGYRRGSLVFKTAKLTVGLMRNPAQRAFPVRSGFLKNPFRRGPKSRPIFTSPHSGLNCAHLNLLVFDEEHAAQRALEEVGAKEPLAPQGRAAPAGDAPCSASLPCRSRAAIQGKLRKLGETLNNGSHGKAFDIRISRPARFDSRRGRIDKACSRRANHCLPIW
jgi:hypothetical protein